MALAEDVIPIGARLGSERLFTEPPFFGEQVGPQLDPRTWEPMAEHMEPDPPERRDVPDAPERKDMPRPEHRDPRKRKPAKQPHREGREGRLAATQASGKWRNIVGNCCEIAGIASISAGSFQIAAWLGLIVLGVCLILLGVATGVQRAE
jgi:hypothetical protein